MAAAPCRSSSSSLSCSSPSWEAWVAEAETLWAAVSAMNGDAVERHGSARGTEKESNDHKVARRWAGSGAAPRLGVPKP